MYVYILRHLKEELLIQSISNENSHATNELESKAVLGLKQYCIYCYVVLINHAVWDCEI